MIIDLPKSSENEIIKINDSMEVEYGLLKLHFPISFQDCMYDLTYFIKGRETCFYCLRTVEEDKMTLDHLTPQDFGGPTIPNNLVPACKNCNCDKANMLDFIYNKYIKLSTAADKRQFISDFESITFFIHSWYGLDFIKDWIEEKEIDNIIVNISLDCSYRGKKYKKIKEYYRKYKHFQKPIIVDRKNFLLDGFTALMYAKDNQIKKVPVIVLENVEVIF